MNRSGSRTGTIVVGLVFVALAAVLLKIALDLVPPEARGFKFIFALAFAVFLLVVCCGYLLMPQLQPGRRELVGALYPTLGLVTFTYAGAGLLCMLLFYPLDGLFYGAVAVLSVAYLIVSGSLTTLFGHKSASDARQAAQHEATAAVSVRMDEVAEKFGGLRARFDPAAFRAVDGRMRRLAESFRFSTPFGRGSGEAARLEAEIQTGINDLWRKVAAAEDVPAEQSGAALAEIDAAVGRLLGAMDRREQLMVK